MLEPIVGNVELRKHTADEPTGGLRPRSASIIINNYNYGQFVGQAIESALEQTHPAQVIAVDDGSTDDSREIIARFDSRVLPIFKPNGGQGSAMNDGFAMATGDIVLFLDSDDSRTPTRSRPSSASGSQTPCSLNIRSRSWTETAPPGTRHSS